MTTGTVTGTLLTASGSPHAGSVVFTPAPGLILDAAGDRIVVGSPRRRPYRNLRR